MKFSHSAFLPPTFFHVSTSEPLKDRDIKAVPVRSQVFDTSSYEHTTLHRKPTVTHNSIMPSRKEKREKRGKRYESPTEDGDPKENCSQITEYSIQTPVKGWLETLSRSREPGLASLESRRFSQNSRNSRPSGPTRVDQRYSLEPYSGRSTKPSRYRRHDDVPSSPSYPQASTQRSSQRIGPQNPIDYGFKYVESYTAKKVDGVWCRVQPSRKAREGEMYAHLHERTSEFEQGDRRFVKTESWTTYTAP